MTIEADTDFTEIADLIRKEFLDHEIDERDGMRIECPGGWIQIRKSNTEPIMRIYAEGITQQDAEKMADRVIAIVKKTYFFR
jgi:phosphomannomutase